MNNDVVKTDDVDNVVKTDDVDNVVKTDDVDNVVKTKLNEMFYFDKAVKKVGDKNQQGKSNKAEFSGKGVNRKFSENYDIHFMINSELFKNIIEYLNTIGYDVVIRFRKKDVIFFNVDSSTTHATQINVDKTEFSDYNIKGVEGDEEKNIYVDTSILEDMNVDINFPIDFYVDTMEMKRFYIVNGKEIVSKRLNSMTDEYNHTLIKYKSFDNTLKGLLLNKDYQKVIINQNSLRNLMISLAKKKAKNKDVTMVVSIYVKKNEFDFRVETDTKSSSVILSGEDVLVYPLKDDFLKLNIEFFTKFNKLKLSQQISAYIYGNKLPFIIEGRLGGGRIFVYFLIAQYKEGSD